MSKKTAGMVIGIIGGALSILIGIFLSIGYPELGQPLLLILQICGISGGALAIIGGCIVPSNPKTGRILIAVGGLVGLINILTIIGANLILQEERGK